MSEPVATTSPAWLGSWVAACVDGLARARHEIDAMNVFPVPDGDTGTNLYLTMASAWQSLAEAAEAGSSTIADATSALSRGALLGARGNSGVILAQMFHGASEEIASSGDGVAWTTAGLARMLRRACDEGYRAVGQPMEGTILSVARAAAEAAEALELGAAHEASRIAAAADAVLGAAQAALARTPEQLDVLRQAGVVDAGGSGLVVVLESLVASFSGHAPQEPTHEVDWNTATEVRELAGYAGPAYEVMFLIETDLERLEVLRSRLMDLGDSLVVSGAHGAWNVHVHVDDAGAVVDAAVGAGSARGFRITYLGASQVGQPHLDTRGVVAVAHGPGTAELLTSAGATVVTGRPRQRPSTAEFLEAIEHCAAAEVVVLPSDGDARATAELAATEARVRGVRVAVIPTRSIVQTLAAVAVHDPEVGFDADVAVMSSAAGAARYAGVTVASKAALTSAGQCQVGDVLGIVDGDIVEIGDDVDAVTRRLIERLLASGGDLLTVVLGSDAPSTIRDGLASWVRKAHPLTDVVVHDGGQPLWPVILGVE